MRARCPRSAGQVFGGVVHYVVALDAGACWMSLAARSGSSELMASARRLVMLHCSMTVRLSPPATLCQSSYALRLTVGAAGSLTFNPAFDSARAVR
jgi:hypothetical protein